MILINLKKLNLDIKTKYLYGSRMAWRIPDEENYEEIVEKVFKEYLMNISTDFISYRFNIPNNYLKEKLNIRSGSHILLSDEREKYKEIVLNNQEVKNYIIKENSKRVELLKKYLKQELDLSNEKFAFVEIHGWGRTQDILANYINQISYPERISINTYYLYLLKPKSNICENKLSQKKSYFLNDKSYFHTVELLTRTLYGQTVGYKTEDNKIVPILERINPNAFIKWGYNEYLQGIIDFAENMANSFGLIENVDFCYFYFDYLTTKCDKRIAETIGTIPYLPIGNETKAPEAAPKMKFLEYLYSYYTGTIPDKYWVFPHITIKRSQNGICKYLNNFNFKPEHFDLGLKLKLLFKLYLNRNKKIMFWGASLFLEDFIKNFDIKYDNIIGIVDKNKDRQGNSIGKYKIYSPDEINKLKPDVVILSIKNNARVIYGSLNETWDKDYPNIDLVPGFFR